RDRAQRTALLSGRFHRRARLLQAGPARASLWAERRAADLCSRRRRCQGARGRATGPGRRPRSRALPSAKRAGAQAAQSENADPGGDVGGVVSRALRPLHREVSAAGGADPTFMRLGDLGIKGNSHVMMNEKNNREIAAVIAQWLARTLPAKDEPRALFLAHRTKERRAAGLHHAPDGAMATRRGARLAPPCLG